MAARAGMANLILRLRAMTNAGTADYSVAGTTYWIDDQLEDRLDHHRKEYREIALYATPKLSSGTYSYTEYRLPLDVRDVEESGSGSYWRVYSFTDGDQAVTTDYTVNYESGIITFNADTLNHTYYLDVTTFDLYRAAAEVCDGIVGHFRGVVDWSSDNHSVKASQYHVMAQKNAAYFRNLAGPKTTKLFRSDMLT